MKRKSYIFSLPKKMEDHEYDTLHCAIMVAKAHGLKCVRVPHTIYVKSKLESKDDVTVQEEECYHKTSWICDVWGQAIPPYKKSTHIMWSAPVFYDSDFETRLAIYGSFEIKEPQDHDLMPRLMDETYMNKLIAKHPLKIDLYVHNQYLISPTHGVKISFTNVQDMKQSISSLDGTGKILSVTVSLV